MLGEMMNLLSSRSFSPQDAQTLELLLAKTKNIFESQGFLPIQSPTIDDFNGLSKVMTPSLNKACIKFFDHQGHIKVLRPDHTISIAKLAASQLQDNPLPLKLYYQGPVFRQFSQETELYQTGVEYLGCDNLHTELDILKLAVTTIKTLGIADMVLDIGHKQGHHHWSDEEKKALLEGRYDKLNQLPIRESIQESTQHIPLLKELETHDIHCPVYFNEALISPMDYYTGMMFEIYSPKLNCLLSSGGRYDALLNAFGWSIPAVGFAIHLNPFIEKGLLK